MRSITLTGPTYSMPGDNGDQLLRAPTACLYLPGDDTPPYLVRPGSRQAREVVTTTGSTGEAAVDLYPVDGELFVAETWDQPHHLSQHSDAYFMLDDRVIQPLAETPHVSTVDEFVEGRAEPADGVLVRDVSFGSDVYLLPSDELVTASENGRLNRLVPAWAFKRD